MTAELQPQIRAAKLIGESFRLLFANLGILFPLALAPALLQEAIFIALVPSQSIEGIENPFTTGVLLAMLLATIISSFAMGMISLATADCLDGRRASLNSYFQYVLARIVPIVVAGTIIQIAASIAMLLFILPGIYVYAQFLVWLPCILFEDAGLGAPGRAQYLTSGYRWPLVGALIIIALLVFGLMIVIGPILLSGMTGPGRLLVSLASAVFTAFSYGLVAIFMTVVYRKLIAIKEGAAA